MVAIVSGNSLGLELTSLGTLGNQGTWGTASQGGSGEQVYVNAVTGNLVVQRRDDFLASRGPDNQAIRTYNSLGLLSDDNADNWSLGVYAQQIVLTGTVNTAGSTLIRTARDGSQAVYNWDAARACYITSAGSGAHDTAIYNSVTAQYECTDGSTRAVEKYSATNNRLVSIADANGNATNYTYDDASGRLSKVVDQSGETTWYDYAGNQLTQIRTEYTSGAGTVSRTTVRYGYDTSGRLSTVTVDLTPEDDSIVDGRVYTTTYAYDGTSNRVQTLTQSDGTQLTFTYVLVGSSYRVETVTDALGAITRFAYNTSTRRTTVTDALLKTWLYDYDSAGQLTKVTSPSVDGARPAQAFAYDADGNVTKITNGDGEAITMVYDANGNVIQETDDQSNYITRTYSASNQLLTESTTTMVAAPVANQGGVRVDGTTVIKSVGTDGEWDASFRSSDAINVGQWQSSRVVFKPAQKDKAFVVGLNTDPGLDHTPNSIDYALFCTENGTLEIWHNGQLMAEVGTYLPGEQLEVVYTGSSIEYLREGDLLYSAEAVANQVLYADSSFRDLGAGLTDLDFVVDYNSHQLVAPNGVTVTAGTATKFSGADAWDAGLRSIRGTTGSAIVSFRPAQINKGFMMGLSTDPTSDGTYGSLNWGLYCSDNSAGELYADLYLFEGGNTTKIGVYKAGDLLQIERGVDNSIIYWQNGKKLKTRTGVQIDGPVYLNSSFYGIDAKVTDIQFDWPNGEPPPLPDIVSIAQESAIKIAGDSIKKVGGTDASWDSAARSKQGYTGGANVTFAPTRTDKALKVGLTSDPNAGFDGNDIDWALYCTATGALLASEDGLLTDLGATYIAGDRLQVTYDGSTIKYLKNGQELRSVTVSINSPLYLDSSFYDIGGRVTILRFGDSVSPELTVRYVYSASRPELLRFVITPEGRVTKYDYNAFGERTSQVDYPASAYNVADLPSTEVPTEAQMLAWADAQDQSRLLRKGFEYDARGLLTFLDEYEATNPDGSGQTLRQTHFIYDQSGRLLQTLQPSGSSGDEAGTPVTQYTYDGLGRVLSVSNAYGLQSITTYNDSAQQVIVNYVSGASQTSVYDRAGRLVSVARSGNGSTSYAYDAEGHLLMTTDPTGVRTFSLFDARGRRIAVIDGNGTLTEYTYDKADRLVREYSYSKSAVPLSLLYDATTGRPLNPSLTSIRPVSDPLDLQSWKVYDDAGRLTFEIGDGGELTRYDYDGASRVVSKTQYATAIATTTDPTFWSVSAQLDNPAVIAAAPSDRVTRYFHDHDGNLTGTLDAEGYLTRRTFDHAGRLVSVRRYATQIDYVLQMTGTLEAVTPAADAGDQVEVYFYNARNQLVGQVDAERYLTTSTYNERGELRIQTRFSTALATTPAWTARLTDLVASIRPGGTLQADDRQSTRYYRLDGKLLKETNFEGTSTSYEYDAAGNLTKTTIGVGESDARAPQVRYDTWGRKTAELSAEAALLITGGMTQAQIDQIWQDHGSHYTYDSANRLTSFADANQHKTLYYYNVDGQLTHTINALGEVEERTYNALGRHVSTIRYGTAITSLAGLNGGLVDSVLTQAITANTQKDSVVHYGYDDHGRLQSTTDAMGATQSNSYNVFGEVQQRLLPWQGGADINVDRREDLFVYDRRGLLKQVTSDAAGIASAVATQFDAFGRVVQTDSNGVIRQWGYDRLGRVVQTINAQDPARVSTFDAFGQTLTVTDELLQATQYTYDRANRSVTMTTPEGVSVTTVHTRYGQTYTITDGNNVVTQYSYDRNGRLKDTTVNGARVEHRDYDDGGRLVASIDGRDTLTTYTYDAANRTLTRTVEPTDADAQDELNLVTRWDYDAKGQAWRVTAPGNRVTEYTFYLDGRTATQTADPNGLHLTTQWAYDADGRVLTVTDPLLKKTQYAYDKLGRRMSEVQDLGGLNLTRSYSYDKNGNVLSATDARQNTTRYRYDAAGRLEYTADAAGAVTRSFYDERGHLSQQISYANLVGDAQEPNTVQASAADRLTRYYYDNDGRLQYTVDPFGALTKTEYDDAGNVSRITRSYNTLTAAQLPNAVQADARDRVTRFEYDAFNREAWRADANGTVTHSEYDGSGNLITRTTFANPVGPDQKPSNVLPDPDPGTDRVERFIHDAANRLTWRSDATGAVTEFEYNDDGTVARTTRYATPAPNVSPDTVHHAPDFDSVTRYTYDSAGRVEFTIDAVGSVTKREYDDNGNVVTLTRYFDTLSLSEGIGALLTDDRDQVTRIEYDAVNRETWRANAMGEVSLIEYDGNGNVVKHTRFAKTVVASVSPHDVVPDTANDRVERCVYDGSNRQTWCSDASGAVTGSKYDAFGNVVESTRYASLAFGTSPDTVSTDPDHDRVTSFVYDIVHHWNYTVDSLGYVTRTDLDAFGNVTALRRYNDKPNARSTPETALANDAVDRFEYYEYDAAGRLETLTDAYGHTEKYTYDAFGNRLTFKNKNDAVWTYTYDGVGRLLIETSPEVDLYSSTRNLGTGDVDIGAMDTAPVVTTLTYDAFGNVQTRIEATGRAGEERTTTYEYDLVGRQIRVTYPVVAAYSESLADLAANTRVGEAARDEASLKSPVVTTWYDSFGNAVASTNASGWTSYKAYDAAGRVRYEIDALGYVTDYDRNAFGEATVVTRFGEATALNQIADSDAARLINTDSVGTAVQSLGHADDRVLVNHYDVLGRVIEVVEPAEFYYDADTGQTGTASKATRTEYNAFGELMRVRQKANAVGTAWLDTIHYYDQGGLKRATADAAGHLTTFDYDREGNLLTQVEYAKEMSPNSWNVDAHGLPGSDEADRTTTWTWDLLNRKSSETKMQVETFTGATATNVDADKRNLTTSFHYDAVGNLTLTVDAAGGETRSYYDALGRVTLVVAPMRMDQYGVAGMPVTRFLRDASGNAVRRIDYAAMAANLDGVGRLKSTDNDRVTNTAYDLWGHATQSDDALGYHHYNSYTMEGQLAKSWQTVTARDENFNAMLRTSYAAYAYDELGRLVHSYSPGPVEGESVVTDYSYNGFGELMARLHGSEQEYFEYDHAGHLWKTNSGEGVARIFLYDLLGRQTADITSAGSGLANSVDVATLTSAEQAATRTDTRRINLKYNQLGHVVERQEAERLAIQGVDAGVTISEVSAAASVAGSMYVTTEAGGENGLAFYWGGSNSVNLSWTTLADLGAGDVKVDLTYQTQDTRNSYGYGSAPVAHTESQVFAGYLADTGAQLNWTDPSAEQVAGKAGVSAISRLVVYKRNANGDWVKVIDRDPAAGRYFGDYGTRVEISAPADPTTALTFHYRPAGTTQWITAPLTSLSDADKYWFDTSTLIGAHEYEVWQTPQGGAAEKTQSGTFGSLATRKLSADATIHASSQFHSEYMGGEDSSWKDWWTGSNAVDLDWSTLAYLGAGDVRIDLTYLTLETRTSPPVIRTQSQVFPDGANAGGLLTWTDTQTDQAGGIGGISAISRLVVYKLGANGDWVKLVDREPGAGRSFGDYGTRVEVAAPADATTAVTFRYRSVLAAQWTTASLSTLGDTYWFDISALSGDFEYEVWQTPLGGTAQMTQSGKFVAGADSTVNTGNEAIEPIRPIILFERDRWGNATSQSDPRNSNWLTKFTYSRDNQVATETRPDPLTGGQTSESPKRSIYFDELGRQRAVQGPENAQKVRYVNTTEWDAGGNLVSEVHADGGQVTYFYDAFGQRVKMVDAVGNGKVGTPNAPDSDVYRQHTTIYAFDNLGRQTSTVHGGDSSLGAVTAWHVNDSLDLVADGRKNLTETFAYDELGHMVEKANGAFETTRYRYDLAGNIVETELPGGQSTTATYDAYGHKISETDANGRIATWGYSYFGRLLAHKDIGDATYTYLYDAAGQLTQQTNTRHQLLQYGYDAAGQLIRIEDGATHQITTTAYDLAGRHLHEKVVYTGDGVEEVLQDNHLSYDVLGRLVDSADNRAHLTFEYDKAGNRTKLTTHVFVAAVNDPNTETLQNGTRYFVYDEMNRQTAVDAVDSLGNIGDSQGHQLTYDLNGNRLTDYFWGNKVTSTTPVYYFYDWESGEVSYTYVGDPVYSKSSGWVNELYTYDALNRLQTVDRDGTIVDQRWYDSAGRVVQSGPKSLPIGYAAKLNEDVPADEQIGMELRRQRYDSNGRLLVQRVWKSDGTTLKHDIDYTDEVVIVRDTEVGSPTYGQIIDTYTLRGYDDEGNVIRYRFKNYDGDDYTNTTTIDLNWFEGYVEAKTNTTSTKFQNGSVTSDYDANGYLIGVDDATENTLDRTIVNDAAGRALRVTQNGNKLYTHIVNGQILGRFGVGPNELDPRTSKNQANFQQVADFELGYRSITGNYPAPGVGAYTVRQGDSLQAIAQAAFGDSSQWWRIAQANGLQSDRDLRVGQTLTLPSAISGTSNNSGTFKPYNPSDVVGDTSPNLPQPHNKGKCGLMSQIIGIVVAAVVTYFTGDVSAGAAAGDAARQYSYAAFNGELDYWDMVRGGGSHGLRSGLKAGALYAVGGWSGLAAMDEDDQPPGFTKDYRYDYKSTALAATTAYIGSAVGVSVVSNPYWNAAANAAIGNALTQGVAMAVGVQRGFSWSSLAASAVGAMGAEGVAQAGGQLSLGKTVTGVAAGITRSTIISLARFGRVDGVAVATDAFGNALGSSLVDAMSSPSAADNRTALNKANQTADADYYGSGTASTTSSIGSDEGIYLSRAQEERLRSGLTMTDAGAPLGEGDYADGADVLRLKSAKDTRSEAAISRATEQRDQRIKLDEMQKSIADLKALLATASAEGSSSWPAEGGGLKVETNFPFPAEALPEGGFFRGLVLGQSGSVLDANQPDWAENVGAGVHGLLTMPVHTVTGLVGEAGNQYSDMYNLLTRSRSEFTPSSALLNSLERNGIGGTLWNMTESVFSAPTQPIFDLLDGNYEQAGAGLPGTFATGMGVVSKVGKLRLGEATGTELIDFNNISELAPGLYRADPKQLRFMQPTVSPNYSEGGYTVASTAEDLRAGRVTPDQLGDPLRVVMIDGRPFSFDNRRLLSYSLGDVSDVPIQVMGLDDPVFAAKVDKRFNPIRNEGLQVVVVPSADRSATISELYQLGLVRKKN